MKQLSTLQLLKPVLTLLIGFACIRQSAAQCTPPLDQFLVLNSNGVYSLYWLPFNPQAAVDYQVDYTCTSGCNGSVTVNHSNVLKMNYGYLGVNLPPLGAAAGFSASIVPSGCQPIFFPTILRSIEILSDNLDMQCGPNGLVKVKGKKLPNLFAYADSLCGAGNLMERKSKFTSTTGGSKGSLNIKNSWIKITINDSIPCDTCILFNFLIICADSTLHVVEENVCTSPLRLADISSFELPASIFPNPATANATLQLPGSNEDDVSITIFNTMGQMVMTLDHMAPAGNEGDVYLLPTASLVSGIYLVQVRSGTLTQMLRLVKE